MCASTSPMRRMPCSILAMISFSVKLLDAKILPELVDDGQERDGLAKGNAAAFEPGHRVPSRHQGTTAFQHEA